MSKRKKRYVSGGFLIFLVLILFFIMGSLLKNNNQNKSYNSNKKGNIAYASKSSKTSPIYKQEKQVKVVGTDNEETDLQSETSYKEQDDEKGYNIEILISIICLGIATILLLFFIVWIIFIIKKRNKKIKE